MPSFSSWRSGTSPAWTRRSCRLRTGHGAARRPRSGGRSARVSRARVQRRAPPPRSGRREAPRRGSLVRRRESAEEGAVMLPAWSRRSSSRNRRVPPVDADLVVAKVGLEVFLGRFGFDHLVLGAELQHPRGDCPAASCYTEALDAVKDDPEIPVIQSVPEEQQDLAVRALRTLAGMSLRRSIQAFVHSK